MASIRWYTQQEAKVLELKSYKLESLELKSLKTQIADENCG